MAKPEQEAAQQDRDSAEERKRKGSARLGRAWYEERNREIVVYYLIAVCFLELIVGAIAFFYGVTNAEPLVAGGPRMARFPWVGWLVAAVLSPVGLLLLLHLSGQFFSRSLNAGNKDADGAGTPDAAEVPKRLQRLYAVAKHAPTIVVLLAIIALGCAVLFVDSAMDMAMAVGGALKPYIVHIIVGIVAFLVIGYLGRLIFLAKARRTEQEYAYRMKVLEKTGIVIMNRDCLPLRYENGELKLLAQGEGGQLKALPETESADAGAPTPDEARIKADGDPDDVEEAQIVEKRT